MAVLANHPRSEATSAPASPVLSLRRRTPPDAGGEPAVWTMGLTLAISLAMIAALVVVIVWRGGTTFLVRPIDRVTLATGEAFLGIPVQDEVYEPLPSEAEAIAAAAAAGTLPPHALTPEGQPLRRRYRVGNRDLGQQPFRWVPLHEVAEIDRPPEATLVERRGWGVFLGFPDAVLVDGEVVARGEAVREELKRQLAAASERAERHEELTQRRIPSLVRRLSEIGWERRGVRRELEQAEAGVSRGLPAAAWAGVLLGAIASGGAGLFLTRRVPRVRWGVRRRLTATAAFGAFLLAGVLALAAALEHPWAGPRMTPERLARVEAELDAEAAEIQAEQAALLAAVRELEAEDARYRVRFVDPLTGRFSPESGTLLDRPMKVSQVVRTVPANAMSGFERAGVYLARWAEYLSQSPREGGTEGGVFPIILGTVVLTLLLTVSVVPLGVIAAIYLREYAPQGFVTSVVRIAINNLAGVPSIVYGMFGFGFFCLTLGRYIDAGPQAPMPRADWWPLLATLGLVLLLAAAVGALTAKRPEHEPTLLNRIGAFASGGLWLTAVALALWMVARTPYFGGFFSEKLPESPTFGATGILWASFTLALLTLPVVIVATEEAIAAVPRSMREGSIGCGASRWQTISRIVIPAASPGILTGAILAMARGAGEVAPIMLVGAVNLAPAPPVSTEAPFLHGDRPFMHLGFHIYNLGFQSPDSEAALPLVWTTTLLLIAIVLVLNLTAVILRARIRAKTGGPGL